MNERPMTLEKIAVEDWPAVHTWAGTIEACRYQAWGPNTEDQTRQFVVDAVDAWLQTPQQRFAYIARVGQNVVGMGELHIRNSGQRQGEITYIVQPKLWRQGHGTAIGRRLLSIGFGHLGLHRIYATCDPRNGGSAGVLARIGMTHEGLLRHTALIRDGWRDSLIFGILEDEWHPAKQA